MQTCDHPVSSIKVLSLFTGTEFHRAGLRIFLDSAYQVICGALHMSWVTSRKRRSPRRIAPCTPPVSHPDHPARIPT